MQNPIILSMSLLTDPNVDQPKLINAKIPLRDWKLVSKKSEECEITHPEVKFLFEEAATIYGYALIDDENRPWFVEQFTGYQFAKQPFVIPEAGGSICVTPKLNLSKTLAKNFCELRSDEDADTHANNKSQKKDAE